MASEGRLFDLASGARPLKLDQIFGNYYRAGADLNNHVDADGILFSMSVAVGDDCEFVIGESGAKREQQPYKSHHIL